MYDRLLATIRKKKSPVKSTICKKLSFFTTYTESSKKLDPDLIQGHTVAFEKK